jgi:hypothetical protein
MWILEWLPNWIFYVVLLTGLFGLTATYLIRFFPYLYFYKTPIQILSILLIVIGTYMSGAISNEDSWQLKIKDLEAKVSEAEAKSQKENVKIVEKIVVRNKIIQEKGQDIIQYVDREIVKYDTKFMVGGECEIPKEFINSLNRASEAPK